MHIANGKRLPFGSAATVRQGMPGNGDNTQTRHQIQEGIVVLNIRDIFEDSSDLDPGRFEGGKGFGILRGQTELP